jgi:methylmalonyl-CoA/ethylmalonyl-CoA epimerase
VIVDTPGLLGIDHVGIAVTDLDTAIEFYRDRWGMTLAHRETNEEQGVAEALMSVGDSTIQLLAPLTPDSPIASFLDKRGAGLQQLAYRVADVRVASDALRNQGMRLLYEEPKRGTAGSLINFVHPASAGGVLIELVEHPRS